MNPWGHAPEVGSRSWQPARDELLTRISPAQTPAVQRHRRAMAASLPHHSFAAQTDQSIPH